MELSDSVQKGLQSLSDPAVFDQGSFPVLLDVSFRSLGSLRGDAAVLDRPELKKVDQLVLKQCHAAAASFILEAVKHDLDPSSVSSHLEEIGFSSERIEIFLSAYQKHKKELEGLLASIGNRPTLINDVSWRLQYHMKNGQVDKVNEPFYLISLNTENKGTSEDINFTCSMEQLQDLVGKLKDAAKSAEKASQM
ncbi:COMM domain-containing protein 3 [Neosynchiropus ocellatus]